MNKLLPDLDWIAANTTDLWEEVRGERLFVTGGTGFFGCWIAESFCHVNRLLGLRAKMTILTRNPETFARKCPHLASDAAVSLIAGDVRTFHFPQGEFRYILHLATEARVGQAFGAPMDMLSTIIGGTERALQFAASCGAEKFLLASSGAVYGRQPGGMTHIPESYGGGPDTMEPASVYAEGKRTAELLCNLYQSQSKLQCKIARCFAFCGPYLPLDVHFAIGNFIGDALARRDIQIQGDGTPRRSYLYSADLAIWLWTILFRAPALTPLNVGSARDVSILELAQTIADTLAPESRVTVAQEADRNREPARYVPCVDLAHQLLGLRETVGLEECVRRTAAWHQATR